MKNYKSILYLLFSGVCLCSTGCTDLDEEVFSEVTESTFTPTESDIASLLASTYSPLRYSMSWRSGLFDLQEEPGDIIVTPTRPNGWDDGGMYKRMHLHTWTDQEEQPNKTWDQCYKGINNANRVLMQIESGTLPVGDKKESIIAELRAVRAFWYSILCDTHGNVPIQKDFSDELPLQSSRQEVFNFVISEVNEALPHLSDQSDKTTYGRMNQWAARHLLAKMYLNAEVYTGTPQWEKCIEECDQIIQSGKFSLETNYRDLFKTDNENNTEMIFAIPYDKIYATGFYLHLKALHTLSSKIYNMEVEPYNGNAANPQFIDSYQPGDKRLQYSWLMGDQKDPSGNVLFSYRKELPSLYKTGQFDGYRIGKYEIEMGAKDALSNDYPFYRYTETLMMKAECLMRLGRPGAGPIVSSIRARAFDDPTKAQVTDDELVKDTSIRYGILDENGTISDPGDQTPVLYGRFYDELGWEFAGEIKRRTDMIRFGTFHTKSWFNHKPNSKLGKNCILFPIGYNQLHTNENLKQNPGY